MPETSSTITSFEDLSLAPAIIKAVKDAGYETPSPIQAQSIPHLIEGRDLLGLAQTGTGKTAAFALPLLSRIDIKQKHPQVLVLTPTRELAIQVSQSFQRYASHMQNFHVLAIYGGQDMRSQLRGLQRGIHVAVGTPGRIMDHIRRNSLHLEGIKTVVLDEGDEMLRMGFVDDIEWIMERTPPARHVALFSATMPPLIRKIAGKYLKNPANIEIKAKTTTVETIKQKVLMINGVQKLDALTRILEVEPVEGMIIFVRTKTATVELTEKLEAQGFSAAALNGDMSQVLRGKAVDRIKRNSLDILVATDVAARGLDIERISHVINYDIPHDTEAYVHRIGRTGRAGRKGTAILFASHRERRMLFAIERATRQRLEILTLPSMSDVRDIRIKQFKESVITSLANKEKLTQFKEVVSSLVKENDITYEDLSAALCYLAQQERPFPDAREPQPRGRNTRDRHPQEGKRRSNDSPRRSTEGMIRYRVELGREQGISPRDLVGAIANEGGIPGKDIGHIRLFESCSSIYLPEGLNENKITILKRVRIRNQILGIRPWQNDGSREHTSKRKRIRTITKEVESKGRSSSYKVN